MLIVGTYTEKVSDTLIGEGKGVYFLSWDEESGKSKIVNHAPVTNVSYMAVSKKYDCLYVAEELLVDRKPKFQVYKYNEISDKKYDLIHEVVLNGSSACHLAMSKNEEEISVSCYTSGNAEIFDIDENGIVSYQQSIVHTGKGPNPVRQEAAHIHMTQYFNNRLFVVDLGIDKVKIYENKNGVYKANTEFEMALDPGSGARHMVMKKDGSLVFVLSELSGEVYIFQKGSNSYKRIQKISIISNSFDGVPSGAAIRISKDEQTIYVSERATSTITALRCNKNNWAISQQVDSGGLTPRDINIDPSGEWLVVANQDSHNLSFFEINTNTGSLQLKKSLDVPSPACLIWD